ncbi:MAG: oxidoreductase, partial [Elusimicrobiota bacterium]
MTLSREELLRAVSALEALVADPGLSAAISVDERVRLLAAAGRLSRPARLERSRIARSLRKERRRLNLESDRIARAAAGIRVARLAPVFTAPALEFAGADEPPRELTQPQACYVCKAPYTRLHRFYDGMCPDCSEFNYAKRFQSAD